MSDYKVYKVWVPEVEFELLILCIPNEEVDDKLAYFARDKGLIKKSFYEDFLIITCVANINQLMAHMNQNMDKDKDASSIRETVISEILRVNPILQPENLIINRNLVVKIKSDESADDRPLTSNRSWIIVDEVTEDSPDEEESDAETSKEQQEELAQDVDYTVVRRWWKRLRRYIDIKKFNENDISALIGKVFFYNKSTFYTYINSVCVVDLEDLFESLDTEGILNRVSPPVILGEIYELCKDVNPFLTFENAKNITGNEVTDKHDEDACDSKCSKASNSTKKEQSKKKKKKTFRDVKKEDLLSLSASMKKAIVGQDAAIDQLTDAIKRASVGLKDPERPIGSFIFAGSTGCGKSLTSKVLAEKLTKDKNNLTIIDCSEYMADHEYSKLIGSPMGYVGYEQGGILTNAILENPFNVVVFDEIEKASHKVYDLMLQILDNGRLTDNKGNKVSFKDTIIIMTSNIGVSEVKSIGKVIGFGDVAKLTDVKKAKAIDGAIKDKFRPEFINRIDSIVYFNTLTRNDYLKIIDLELNKLNDNLMSSDTEYKDIKLSFDGKTRSYILKNGTDESLGARPLKRYIEKNISTPLANKLLNDNIDPNATIHVTTKKGKVTFTVNEHSPLYNDVVECSLLMGEVS